MFNGSGSTLKRRFTAVYFGEPNNEQFTTSTTGGDMTVVGIAVDSIGNATFGLIQTLRYFTDAKVTGAMALGDFLVLNESTTRYVLVTW